MIPIKDILFWMVSGILIFLGVWLLDIILLIGTGDL